MSQTNPQANARPIRFAQTIPILRIFDVDPAKAFYVGYLGFSVDWEHRFERNLPLYMQVSGGDLTLHLSEHQGDATPGSTVFVIVSGLDEFHREITARRYRYLRPAIERMPWNADVMEVRDPFGNRIRFNEYVRQRPNGRRKRKTSSKIRRKPDHKRTSRSHA